MVYIICYKETWETSWIKSRCLLVVERGWNWSLACIYGTAVVVSHHSGQHLLPILHSLTVQKHRWRRIDSIDLNKPLAETRFELSHELVVVRNDLEFIFQRRVAAQIKLCSCFLGTSKNWNRYLIKDVEFVQAFRVASISVLRICFNYIMFPTS